MSATSKDRKMRLLGLAIVMIAVLGAFAGGGIGSLEQGEESVGKLVALNETVTASGSVNEGSDAPVPFKIVDAADAPFDIDRVISVTFVLSWSDTPAGGIAGFGRWYENTPDTLTLKVTPPIEGMQEMSESASNAQGGSGEVRINFVAAEGAYWDVRDQDWNVTVFADDCGDEVPRGIGLIPNVSDTSTEWSMDIEYKFMVPEGSVAAEE